MEVPVDLRTLADSIDRTLQEKGVEFQRVEGEGGDLPTWLVADASGYTAGVLLESNDDSLGIPTVTISILVAELEEPDVNYLADIMARSGELINATMTAQIADPEDEEAEEEAGGPLVLGITRRVPLPVFSSDNLHHHIHDLVMQLEFFFPDLVGEDEPEEGFGEDNVA